MSTTNFSIREYFFAIREIMIKFFKEVSFMEFHERLKTIREKRDIRQKDAATKVGIKNNTLSSYESGDRKPDYETLIKLADLYEVSIEYLLRGQELPEKEKGSLYFFDMEGLTEEEIHDIKRHIEYVKWKSEQERKK